MKKLKQKYIDAIDRARGGSGRALVSPWDLDGYDPEEGERVEIEGDKVYLMGWNFSSGSRRIELKLGTEYLAGLRKEEER